MTRLPGWAWLLLAFGFATLATYMAFGYIKGRSTVQQVKTTIKVVTTIDNVEKGEILSANRLKKVDLDQEALPKDRDYFTDEKKVEGRMAVESLPPNSLISAKNTEPVIPGMAGKISRGKRAMTVKVDEASGVAGSLTPGNLVDVVLIMDKGEYANDQTATTLFQNLKVLGIGQNTVTLEVTPEQGVRLALAAQQGRISLALRGKLPAGTLPPDSEGPVRGTTALLNSNQRAMPVKVDDASGVSPGDRVDVMLLMDKGDWAKYPLAKILFHDMKVLGTTQWKKMVTLAVTPQEAVDLTWASQEGRISLVRRDSDDKTADKNKENVEAKTVEANAGRFFGKPASISGSLQIIRGIEMMEQVPLDTK